MHLQFGRVFKYLRTIAASPVGLVVGLRVMETGTGSGGCVILGLMVSCSVEHGAGSVTTGPHLHGLVIFWDQRRIETVTTDRNTQMNEILKPFTKTKEIVFMKKLNKWQKE